LAWGLYFQDGASPSFEGIVDLHNRIMFYLVFILFGVTWVMVSIMRNFNKNENKLVYRYLNHGTLIELIWTVGPALVLVAIAFPSFKLLYLMDNKLCPLFVFTNKKKTLIYARTYNSFILLPGYKETNLGYSITFS
jgi:cytochrome c oxidase subunit 2